MKKKASKGGNGNGDKRKTSTGAVNLLNMSDHLSGLIQKAEGPEAAARWAAKCLEHGRAIMKDKKPSDLTKADMIKSVQMLREAGRIDDDSALSDFFNVFIQFKDGKEAIPIHPGLQAEADKLNEEAVKVKDDPQKFIAVGRAIQRLLFASALRHFGEYKTADLVLNDPGTFNRRYKEGMLRRHPDLHLDDDFFKAVAL
jgi:hypothetical protein